MLDNKPLLDLADQLNEIAESEKNQSHARLWRRHFNVEKQAKIPVKCAMFMDHDSVIWQKLIPPEQRVYQHGLEASIELMIRQRLFKYYNIPDDDFISRIIWLGAPCSAGDPHPWGLPTKMHMPEERLGAYQVEPVIFTSDDLDHLTCPRFSVRRDLAAELVARATALLDGKLPVKLQTDHLHYGPFEWAVRLRGIENLLYDIIDRPQFMHRLMQHLTSGLVGYHRQREESGCYDTDSSLGLHCPYDEVPAELQDKLAGGWVYCHAQSAASISPAMYAEFVQPYNAQIAALFRKVYYHGCENLDKKAIIIRELPNLRHFHVSPWTNPETIVKVMAGRPVALEVHSHPTNTLFVFDEQEIRREVRSRIAKSQGAVFDLKLCDIQTIDNADGKLQLWSKIAQEASTS